jgi:hypothetical protein
MIANDPMFSTDFILLQLCLTMVYCFMSVAPFGDKWKVVDGWQKFTTTVFAFNLFVLIVILLFKVHVVGAEA